MAVPALDAHEHGVRHGISGTATGVTSLGHDDRAVTEHELSPVLRDAKAHAEPERVAEPVGRLDDVRAPE